MSLEHTILKVIEKRKKDMEQLLEKRKKRQISFDQYNLLYGQYRQSVNDLYMVLTCHDNPQSEFSILHQVKEKP